MATAEVILNQLHDIQLPSPIAFWPPAIGWFILLALIIVSVFIGRELLKKNRERHKSRRYGLKLLAELQSQYQQKKISDNELASQISQLLRRVALAYYPRQEVAGLQGEEWLAFLQRTGSNISIIIQQWLLVKPYDVQQNKQVTEDLTELFQFCQLWIDKQRHRL